MKVDAKIVARLNELITLGEKVLSTRFSRSSPGYISVGDDAVDTALSQQFGVSSLNLLSSVFGEDSHHFKFFNKSVGKFGDYAPVERGVAVLRAAKDDYENGYLFSTKTLIEAEVFSDLLEQAAELLSKGYYQPAAVVTGCVLEDALRKMCAKHNVALIAKPKLDTMNSDLVKAQVYNLLVQKQVTAWADLRNKAAHGQWSEFTKEDVKNMMAGVETFMAQYYS